MASISMGDASTVTLSRAEKKQPLKDWWLLYIVYVCVNACEWERRSKRRRITSDLCSDDHSLCGCTPALLGLGWNPKNVSRFWEQSAGRELCGICTHFHRGELIWISAIQPICYLIPWKTDSVMIWRLRLKHLEEMLLRLQGTTGEKTKQLNRCSKQISQELSEGKEQKQREEEKTNTDNNKKIISSSNPRNCLKVKPAFRNTYNRKTFWMMNDFQKVLCCFGKSAPISLTSNKPAIHFVSFS